MFFRVFKKKIFIKLSKIILVLLNLPLLILIILVNPFLKIRINELETRAIGHFSISTEIFLSELSKNIYNEKNTIYLWFINKKISNNFLLKKWQKKIIIGPRFFLEPLFVIIQKFSFLSFLRSPFRHWKECDNKNKYWQINDIHNVLPKTKSNIRFKPEEEKQCNSFLKKINTSIDNYVCFFSRSHHYYNESVQLKDSDIKNQLKGVKDLSIKNKITAIRIGSKSLKLNVKNRFIFDYANSKYKSEMLDIYLPMNSKFMIGTSSGMNLIPALNRKKTLLVDKSDIHAVHGHSENYIPLMIPKKFKKISNNKILKFSEVFDLKLTEFINEKDLNQLGYKSVSNSSIEISEAIFEMNDLIDKKQNKIKDTKLQIKFWKILYKFHKIKKPKVLRICNSFLKRNSKLID